MRTNIDELEKLKKRFLALLDQELNEQEYQKFLEQNTILIPREFIQNHGVHLNLVLRKLALLQNYITDFFYISKSSIDWNFVMIEIEKPQSRYFKDYNAEFHPDFLRALNQIDRWRMWCEDSAVRNALIKSIEPIMVPLHMKSNPCYFKYVLVYGRRKEFEDDTNKRGLIRAKEREDFKIVSYDSLIESLNTKNYLYLGVRKNEYIDIISSKFIDDTIFSLVEPSYLRITDCLKKDILNNRDSWQCVDNFLGESKFVLDKKLSRIRSINTHPQGLL